jgi:hypothetical protein
VEYVYDVHILFTDYTGLIQILDPGSESNSDVLQSSKVNEALKKGNEPLQQVEEVPLYVVEFSCYWRTSTCTHFAKRNSIF